jgi:antitoxin MazE
MYIHLIRSVTMQVSKWGNSLAIRIPASVSEALKLKEGDDIEVIVADSRTFAIRRQPSRDELLAQLKAYRGRLPADFIFDRDDANEGARLLAG